MVLSNVKGEQNTITDALQLTLPEHAVISVIGSGGKTSLIFAWARELADAGKSVAITTTTHMLDPEKTGEAQDNIEFAFSPDPENPDKVIAPPQDVLDHLYETADVTLIEADGSRRMPLKWPAQWEPVVPERTDITVCVAGLSALGRKPEDVIYRADEMPEAIRRDPVDVNLIHKLISSREGGRKCVHGDFRVFLNQVDEDLDRLAAAYRLQQILSVMGIQTAWGSLCQPAESSECYTEQGEGSSSSRKLAVILEAAGNSTRFGSNKLLHIMEDGRPMASCIMDAVAEAEDILGHRYGSSPVTFNKILVTQYEEIAELAPDFKTVINEHPELGISLSMQLGIEAAADADAYMFCVCDQPGITAETLVRLIDAYYDASKKGTAPIVSLAWQGAMCNPKIFSSTYRDELMSLSGDTGGRQIISSHSDDLILVEASSEDEVRDIDEMTE